MITWPRQKQEGGVCVINNDIFMSRANDAWQSDMSYRLKITKISWKMTESYISLTADQMVKAGKKWLSLCEAGLRYFRPFNTTSCMYHCYCDHTGERSDDFQNKIANVNEPEVQTNASWISDNSCYKMSNLWSICDDRKRKPYTVGVPKDWISFLDENHTFPGGNSRGEIARNV